MSDPFYHKLTDLLVEYIGPQAKMFETLSSGEQRVARLMNEYFWLMVKQNSSNCEDVWKCCEPEFREYFKRTCRSELQNACVLNPVRFAPKMTVKTDLINTPKLSIDQLDNKLVELIRDAVQKTQEIVSKHEWLKPGRMPKNTKVGHFVTTLRRGLTLLIATIPDGVRDNSGSYTVVDLKGFLSKLLDSDNWEDVGFPKLYGSWGQSVWNFSCVYDNRIWRMDGNRLMDICRRAGELSVDEETSKQVEATLAELQREMYPLRSHVEKMQRINRESEQIIGNLCAIVESR